MKKDCSECKRFDPFHTSRACHDCKPWLASTDQMRRAADTVQRGRQSMSKKPITEDIARMCNMCRDLGYIGALADEYHHDSTGSDIADKIATYITELFNSIMESEVEE